MDSAPFKEGTVWSQRCVLSPRLFQSFRIASNRSSPTPRTFWKGSSMGMTARLSGWSSFTTRSKKPRFFIVIIAFYDGHFKDEAAVILRPEGFHIGSILLQGITGKGPLTFWKPASAAFLSSPITASQRLARAWYSGRCKR